MRTARDILDPDPSFADIILGGLGGIVCGVVLALTKVYSIYLLWSWYVVKIGGFTYQPSKLMIYGLIIIFAIMLVGNTGSSDWKDKLTKKQKVYADIGRYLYITLQIWLGVGIAYAVYYFLA